MKYKGFPHFPSRENPSDEKVQQIQVDTGVRHRLNPNTVRLRQFKKSENLENGGKILKNCALSSKLCTRVDPMNGNFRYWKLIFSNFPHGKSKGKNFPTKILNSIGKPEYPLTNFAHIKKIIALTTIAPTSKNRVFTFSEPQEPFRWKIPTDSSRHYRYASFEPKHGTLTSI